MSEWLQQSLAAALDFVTTLALKKTDYLFNYFEN